MCKTYKDVPMFVIEVPGVESDVLGISKLVHHIFSLFEHTFGMESVCLDSVQE